MSPPELLIVAVSARLVSQSRNLSCWIQNLSFCQDWEIQNKLQKQRNSMKKNLVEELRARAGWEVEVSAWILLLLPVLVRSVPQPGVSLSTPFCWRLMLVTSGALLFCPSGPLRSPSPPCPPCPPGPPIPGKLGVAHLRAFSSCRHSLAAARFLRIEGILLRDGPSRRLWKKRVDFLLIALTSQSLILWQNRPLAKPCPRLVLGISMTNCSKDLIVLFCVSSLLLISSCTP